MNAATFRDAGPVLHAQGWPSFPADSEAKTPRITGWNLLCQPDGGMTGEELDELIACCGDDACSIAVRPDLLVVDPDVENPDQAVRLEALADR